MGCKFDTNETHHVPTRNSTPFVVFENRVTRDCDLLTHSPVSMEKHIRTPIVKTFGKRPPPKAKAPKTESRLENPKDGAAPKCH